jgi:hypothetical protein
VLRPDPVRENPLTQDRTDELEAMKGRIQHIEQMLDKVLRRSGEKGGA